MLLRIVGCPVLAVEQRVGKARVRLVHAHHDGTGGEGLRLGFVVALGAGDIDGCVGGQLLHFDVLALKHLEQLHVAIQVRRIVGHDVGRGPSSVGFSTARLLFR